jgi:hypothetical protein
MTALISDFLRVNIILDANFDLSQIGKYDDAEAKDFAEAYRQCAEYIAEKSGVYIDITEASYAGPEKYSIHQPRDEEYGFSLWQDIHSCLDDADGEWKYSAKKANAVAESLIKEAVDGIAEILSKKIDSEISDIIETEMDDASDILTEAVTAALAEKFGR